MEVRFRTIYLSLELMKKLSVVNEASNWIVPYQKFYVPLIAEKVNLRDDYVTWLKEQLRPSPVCTCGFGS